MKPRLINRVHLDKAEGGGLKCEAMEEIAKKRSWLLSLQLSREISSDINFSRRNKRKPKKSGIVDKYNDGNEKYSATVFRKKFYIGKNYPKCHNVNICINSHSSHVYGIKD